MLIRRNLLLNAVMSAESPANTGGAVDEPIVANFDNTLDKVKFKFRWKKDELGNQRPSMEFEGYIPSVEGIVEILSKEKNEKEVELLQEAMTSVIRDAIGEYLAANETATAANIPWAELTWEKIANQPKADRVKIDPKVWEEFGKDYLEIMPGITKKSKEAIGFAVQVYVKKFSQIKTNKGALGKLKDQLALYTEHSPRAGEFEEILGMLTAKVDVYLKADDIQELIAAL